MAAMKWGVWTPVPHAVRHEPRLVEAIADLKTRGGTGVDRSFQFAIDVVRKAEDYGFYTTLIAERFLGPDLEAWILGSALAMQTRSIEVMVAVHPGIVLPQVVAKMGATLDRISGGRFAVNVVNGWWVDEFNLYGNGSWIAASERRYRRMDEFMQVMRGLWTEDIFSFEGEFFHVDKGSLPTKPYRIPSPPIYAASRSDVGKDMIARHGDVWFASYQPDHRLYEENFAAISADIAWMNERAASLGRSLRYGISAHVICDNSVEQANARAAELLAYGQRDPVALVAARALGAGLVGTPQLIAERLARYAAIGIDCPMLHFHPMIDGLDQFAAEVMPLLDAGEPAISVAAR
jgi:dimethylsulfone monooxygenase